MKQVKFLITIALFFAGFATKAQTNSIVFTYDAAGNVIQRELQVLPPCPTCERFSFQTPKDSTEVSPPLDFKIYPNPAQNIVTIEGKLPKDCQEARVQLINSTGQLLKTTTYTGNIKTIDVSDLKYGIYLLEIIYSKKQKSTYKIVVTN
jgi:hypothetical protein